MTVNNEFAMMRKEPGTGYFKVFLDEATEVARTSVTIFGLDQGPPEYRLPFR